ncbi:MAG: hypothetical protein ACKVPY_10890 [Paracoccaceae bacterium]
MRTGAENPSRRIFRRAEFSLKFCTFGPACLLPTPSLAHATNQSFVLLLPTGYYMAGGLAAVVLTLIVATALSPARVAALYRPLRLLPIPRHAAPVLTSLASAATLSAATAIGALGPPDPTRNLLPLLVWTVFWTLLVALQGLTGGAWRHLNPFTGPFALARALGWRPPLRLPQGTGHWPALAFFLAIVALLLVHVTPASPRLLACLVPLWWLTHLVLTLLFGRRWLVRGEPMTVLLRAYALIAATGCRAGRLRLGLPGWRSLGRAAPPLPLALMMLALLAAGSFDGLYETFFWFALTGQNPLEFQGRSAVIGQNLAGVLAALPLLAALYWSCLRAGLVLAGQAQRTAEAFRSFAPALLPIALGYHIAHFLPSFLIEIQALPIALSDLLGRGWDIFGHARGHVSTGLFNRLDTVRLLWLVQAGAVVAGHAAAILYSHALALRMFPDRRRAALAGAPLSAFMLAYSLFGLWLLASPRGV